MNTRRYQIGYHSPYTISYSQERIPTRIVETQNIYSTRQYPPQYIKRTLALERLRQSNSNAERQKYILLPSTKASQDEIEDNMEHIHAIIANLDINLEHLLLTLKGSISPRMQREIDRARENIALYNDYLEACEQLLSTIIPSSGYGGHGDYYDNDDDNGYGGNGG
jgi:hypothetical protein